MEGQGFRDRSPEFAEIGAVIYGASFDTPADNKIFADAQAFGFPLLSDVDRSVGRQYGAERDPGEQYADFPKRITYLIDPEGRVAKAYEVTDVKSHPDEVLADVRDLAAIDP